MGKFADDKLHVITKINVSDGLYDVDDDNDTTGNEHAEWDGGTGADVYWLKIVKRG